MKLSRTLPALLVASMAIVAACDDDDDTSTAATEEAGSGGTGPAATDESDGDGDGGDGGVDPCTLGRDAAEQMLAGATCDHKVDGIQDEIAVWYRDGEEEVLRVSVSAEEIDEFPTREDREANRHPVLDEGATYEPAPELGDRAWILTAPDGTMEEGITAYMESDRYILITVRSPVLERADLVTTASAVLNDVAALG